MDYSHYRTPSGLPPVNFEEHWPDSKWVDNFEVIDYEGQRVGVWPPAPVGVPAIELARKVPPGIVGRLLRRIFGP